MRCRFLLAVAALPLVLALAACGDDDGRELDPLAEEVLAPGPYPVGFREASITYDAAATGDDRTLPLALWYPADVGPDDTLARYVVSLIVGIDTDAAYDAPAPAADGPYPVAVYSHGSGGEALLAYPFAERLASHGWVVISANHVGNTATDAFLGDGTAPFPRIVLDRPTDISALLDWLEEPTQAAFADTSRTLLFGHSFGGYTTFAAAGADVDLEALGARTNCDDPDQAEACAILADEAFQAAIEAGFGDPRIDAIVPQAPALVAFGDGELAGVDVPMMLQTGRRDQTTTQQTSAIPSWERTDGADDVWIDMPDVGHFSFLSICDDLDRVVPEVNALFGADPDARLLELFRPDAPEDGCGPSFTPAARVVDALAAYTLAWGRRHVLGETEMDRVIEGPPLVSGFVVETR